MLYPKLTTFEVSGLGAMYPLPLWTLLFLHSVASISFLPLLFSTQLCESLCVFRTVENTWGTDYWLDLSLSF